MKRRHSWLPAHESGRDEMLDFDGLVSSCAPEVHPDTMRRIVQVESSFNPFAIGVVGARLERQPRTRDEAVSTARSLEAQGWNYSVGLAQINRANFKWLDLNAESAFDVCRNLRAAARVLQECFDRAGRTRPEQTALKAAFSCYYSGNFTTGFRDGYVARVVRANGMAPPVPGAAARFESSTPAPLRVIPAVKERTKTKPSDRPPHARKEIRAPQHDAGPAQRANASALLF